MRTLACPSALLLLLCPGCDGGGSDDDPTTAGTMATTTGSGTQAGTTEDSDTTSETPGDTTEQPPGTSSSTGPGPDTGESSGTTTTGGGDPGNWLLTVDRGSAPPRLMRIDLTGGALEVCALAGVVDYTSITFARDGTLYGLNVAQQRIDVIDPCNCSFQIVGPTSLGTVSLGLADTDDELLGIDATLDALVRIDLDTGLGTVVGPLGFMFGNAALGWSDPMAQPFAVEAENDFLYTVAPSTGTATPGQMVSVDLVAPGLAVHPNDDLLYACDGDTFYTIDPSNGLMTTVGPPLGMTGGCQTLTPPQTAVECIDSL